ncbi:holin family protein [Roseovarius rhodophyticola]|uniref:Holin family protein n=1 Tax=Roseovarius rhodophyticola TaxID=3080827 RepID=A0ABZ2TEQ5_9RHOB|nr:holin family protein [Roseovarius sp. W115]MDV2928458.1 holin family protein [Roseovarius sp. W115]
MGLIGRVLSVLFGGERNVVAETAEVFRVNAEAADQRAASLQGAALDQLSAEFAHVKVSWYDRFIDGLNRIPRPAMALGTLGLFLSAMVDPVWFAERMQGIALVPEPLWWLLGAIVSFYFGARHQAKGQEFQRSIAATLARVPQVITAVEDLRALDARSPGVAQTQSDSTLTLAAVQPSDNPALDDWLRQRAHPATM